jgi:hypothetical protein
MESKALALASGVQSFSFSKHGVQSFSFGREPNFIYGVQSFSFGKHGVQSFSFGREPNFNLESKALALAGSQTLFSLAGLQTNVWQSQTQCLIAQAIS